VGGYTKVTVEVVFGGTFIFVPCLPTRHDEISLHIECSGDYKRD